MVHVKKCPLVAKHRTCSRGTPTTEFYIDGEPQIYCYGYKDFYNDEPLEECKNCADWVYGEQCEKDFAERLKGVKKELNCDCIEEKIAEMKTELKEQKE